MECSKEDGLASHRCQAGWTRSQNKNLVPALSRAGVAIGADGLIVEVHPCPEKAVSDGAQSLTLESFRQMMRDLQPYIRLWKEQRAAKHAAAVA